MNTDAITLTIDGKKIEARRGDTILEAADRAGVYVPRLCWMKDLLPAGGCRVCTVRVNGRPQAACTQPVAPGMVIENDTEELRELRRDLIDMLFVEGNHFCMFCEKSGNCELQALAYRFGITAPKYPYLFPQRGVDASHPDVMIDGNRCVLCGRCVRASRALDGKHVFGFTGRGPGKRLAVNGPNLAATDVAAPDRAVAACPTGTLLVKRVGYKVPVGRRLYDHSPIGSEIEPQTPGK
ncbi:MAG: (2Fe-2S)-binding protein [Thermoanaerobaculia bacterium]|nr:(2Fe-2S)-binding protein [Thermoanaerobaculia bacterium]MCZ7652288.1 2Fe-2S iron-sulfur cluster-binding protein [Thermoanaerobaculia bacterium]